MKRIRITWVAYEYYENDVPEDVIQKRMGEIYVNDIQPKDVVGDDKLRVSNVQRETRLDCEN